jgi:citrate lyase subunit beta/citryl-CoA lyase
VSHLALGEADLCADLRVVPTDDVMRPLRMQAVVASAAAGIDQPTAPVSTDFEDLDALRTSTIALRDAGFGARAAIHPAQVAVINEVFTPTDNEVAVARDVLARFEAASGGVTVDADGRMLDEAVVRSARRVLARARTSP